MYFNLPNRVLIIEVIIIILIGYLICLISSDLVEIMVSWSDNIALRSGFSGSDHLIAGQDKRRPPYM